MPASFSMIRLPRRISRQVDDFMVDRELPTGGRVELEDSLSEVGGQANVLGLADIESLGFQWIEAELARGPHGRQPLFLPLGIDRLPENVVHRNRVRCQQQGVVLPGPLGPRAYRFSGILNCPSKSYRPPVSVASGTVFSPYRTVASRPSWERIVAEDSVPSFHARSTSKPPRARRPFTEPVGQALGRAGSRWISPSAAWLWRSISAIPAGKAKLPSIWNG